MDVVEKAKMVAHWFHKNQTDMAGAPYVGHLARVAAPFVVNEWRTAAAVAWLHDVVEDTDCTIRDLFELGFSDDIVMAVDAITQRPGEDLSAYWARVKANPIARAVKVKGDIPDNSDERRLDFLPPHLQDKLRKKYARALEVLGYEYRPEGVDIWYDAPNRLLNNATPRQFVEAGDGTRVLALIAAMADGVAT